MSGAPPHGSDFVPTDQLLVWASNLKFSDLPREAVESLRDDIVDGLGAGLFGSTLPATHAIRDTLLEQAGGTTGPCTIWGTGSQASALDAAVINAAGQNGFELDDYSALVRGVHGSVIVYPVILAVAEVTRAVSGQELMAAAAAGWETAYRISLAMGPTVLDRGWYVSPIYATLGAAVAAGRALRLTPEQMQGCFELALLHASGLAVTAEEGMGKPLSSGEAVRSGLLCAMIAARGGRGPRHAYDHKKGFAEAYSIPKERNDEALVVKPGDPLACANIGYKAYASCGAGQVVSDILSDFMRANPSIGPDTVESVQLRINVTSAGHIGAPYVPSDVTNAQFNLAYCVAAQLLEGDNSVEQFRDDLLADPRILELTRRVKVVPDPTVGVQSTALRNEAYVTLRMVDGTTLEGHAERNKRLDRPTLRKKFGRLASYAISDEAAKTLIATIDKLESVDDVACIAALLAGSSRG